jgi:histone acetyltransferase (RNA polymerase elongator complex component)
VRVLDRFPHPAPQAPRSRILPLFLPFAGCPQRCIFCDQQAQTGQPPEPPEAALDRLAALLAAPGPPAELAFYGGTFTSLPGRLAERLLDAAAPHKAGGRLTAIRCSTRPDALDPGRLADLKRRGLDTVELGVQSFADAALAASRRGYAGSVAEAACAQVRAAGLGLGVQLMPGLPGHTFADFRRDIARACALAPGFVRLYPCLVLDNTPLAELWRAGRYAPWTLPDAVEALALALLGLWDAHVPAARIGLAEQDGLPVLAGPRHPALGQMARARALFLSVRRRVDRLAERDQRPDTLLCPRRWQGEILGQGNALAAEYAALGVAVTFADVEAFTLGIDDGDG